jgi:hypothetical protein
VKIALCLLGSVLASPAIADVEKLWQFMGGQGCSIGADSRTAALAAGFALEEIDAAVDAVLENGTAERQGDYILLKRQICRLRLPDGISSPYTVLSPEIVAITSDIDAFVADGWPGCYLVDPSNTFKTIIDGDEDAAMNAFYDFVATGIISGDLRMYGRSPLEVPPGFRVVAGRCGEGADIGDIRRNHDRMVAAFGEYTRQLGEKTPCSDPSEAAIWTMALSDWMQGVDPVGEPEAKPGYNAWMWLEFQMIVRAAGWNDGMTAKDMGDPRPPLCHYP